MKRWPKRNGIDKMSWRAIPMKFPGTCLVCNKKIEINEVALWAKGLGVKHQACAEVMQLKCIVCGGPAGCPDCEFSDKCFICMLEFANKTDRSNCANCWLSRGN